MDIITIAVVVVALVMFGGAIKLLLTKLVNALLPLASSLEVYAEGVEKKTRLNVNRDVSKLEAEVKAEMADINTKRKDAGLEESEFDI